MSNNKDGGLGTSAGSRHGSASSRSLFPDRPNLAITPDGGGDAQSPHPLVKVLVYTILNLASIPVLALFTFQRGRSTMMHLWQLAQRPSILEQEEQQLTSSRNHELLMQKALDLPSAKAYLNHNNALEYQLREGYCSLSTQRNILKSLPNVSANAERQLPSYSQQTRPSPSTLASFCDSLNTCMSNNNNNNSSRSEQQQQHDDDDDVKQCYKCRAVYGSDGFHAFQESLRQLANDKNVRVAVNFLRSSLFGLPNPTWLPPLQLVVGHVRRSLFANLGILGGGKVGCHF